MTTSQASSDAWMQERLAAWAGRRLSQFRVSEASLILDFRGLDDDYTAWLYADEFRSRRREPPPWSRDCGGQGGRRSWLCAHSSVGMSPQPR